nr:LOW QUALITY PROTEIN: cytochrome P450 3A41-like [Rhipicephalus microplus]
MLLFALVVLLSSLLCWWLRKTFTFWDKQDIAHLTFWQHMRYCIDLYTKPLKEVIIKYYNQNGRLYGSYQGTVPTLVVGDPDILREILVTKFKNFSDRSEAQRIGSAIWCNSMLNLSGEDWKRVRNIFTPALTASKLKTIVMKVLTVAEKMVSRIEAVAADNKSVNMSELAEHISMDTAAALNYSLDLDSEKDRDHPLVKISQCHLHKECWLAGCHVVSDAQDLQGLKPNYPPKANIDIFKAFVSHLVQERESKTKKEDDFLQLYLDAEYQSEIAEDGKQSRDERREMTLDGITGHGIVFFIGGVEGNMMAVTMTAYYLALHPHLQDRVLEEVDKVVSEGGITYDTLQRMPFLEACLKEALRLETHDAIYTRLCTEETTVAGICFKPGMCVDIPLAGIHHDAEYFPEPEKFNPERFLPENKDCVRPFTYMPFGVGPRNCVAMRLGLLQAKASLACLFRSVRLETCPETMVPLKCKPRVLLHSMNGPVVLRPVLRHTSTKKFIGTI